MNPPLFSNLWKNHPGPGDAAKPETYPCDRPLFENQCAIRMGVALEASGIDTTSFNVRRCSKVYPALKSHAPGHILAAQELADALDHYSRLHWLKRALKLKGSLHTNRSQLGSQKGIIFIQNGWGATDHIDLWDGTSRKFRGGGSTFDLVGQHIWFWQLT